MSVDSSLTQAFAHHEAGRLHEAEVLYRDALEADPVHWRACLNLTKVLMLMDRLEPALRWLNWRLQDAHDDVAAHRQLGIAYMKLNLLAHALFHFQRVIDLEPHEAGAHEIIAHILKTFGQADEARRAYDLSVALRDPIQVAYAVHARPAFRLLMTFAPGAGNTPYLHLMRVAHYDGRVLSYVPGVQYQLDALRESTDIVLNLMADFDTAGPLLEGVGSLIRQIGKPVLNDPARIALTGRQAIAERMADVKDCVAPPTRRFTTEQMQDKAYANASQPWIYPLLVRRAGTHGGEDFDKVADEAELSAFVARTSATHYYLTQYVDYASADGWFRKYRFMFVDGEILPYHLAIDRQWKIHHATTDMVHQQWMQDEEAAFLRNPRGVFGERQYAVLRHLRDAVGLDYWGVDCALDREGRVVLFEANATMLVHTNNDAFPYKNQAVARIKRAFDIMLERRAALALRTPAGNRPDLPSTATTPRSAG